MLTWLTGDRFQLGDTTFQAMPEDYFERGGMQITEGDFFVFKSPAEIEEFAKLLSDLQPRRIFELGIHGGGSAVLFAELTRPEKLVTIDLETLPDVRDRIHEHASVSGLGDSVRAFGGVDQGDQAELARLVDQEFGTAELDLVVDDCSHLYGPTKASFDALFPRLRAGGVYVIEDWRWGHTPLGQEEITNWAPEVPLSRLIAEVVLASATLPGLAAQITVESGGVAITRGDGPVKATDFDISALAERAEPNAPAAASERGSGRSPRAGSRWFPRRSG